jgi:hypothetical protein
MEVQTHETILSSSGAAVQGTVDGIVDGTDVIPAGPVPPKRSPITIRTSGHRPPCGRDPATLPRKMADTRFPTLPHATQPVVALAEPMATARLVHKPDRSDNSLGKAQDKEIYPRFLSAIYNSNSSNII